MSPPRKRIFDAINGVRKLTLTVDTNNLVEVLSSLATHDLKEDFFESCLYHSQGFVSFCFDTDKMRNIENDEILKENLYPHIEGWDTGSYDQIISGLDILKIGIIAYNLQEIIKGHNLSNSFLSYIDKHPKKYDSLTSIEKSNLDKLLSNKLFIETLKLQHSLGNFVPCRARENTKRNTKPFPEWIDKYPDPDWFKNVREKYCLEDFVDDNGCAIQYLDGTESIESFNNMLKDVNNRIKNRGIRILCKINNLNFEKLIIERKELELYNSSMIDLNLILYDIRNELFADPAWIKMNALQKQFFSWKKSTVEIESLEYPNSIFLNKCLPKLDNSEKSVEHTGSGYKIHIIKDGFDFFLGADILTSAGIPLRNYLNRTLKPSDGSEDLNKEGWIAENPLIDLSPSQEAFLRIVYSIGNMMPVSRNRGPGGGKSSRPLTKKSGDVAYNKLTGIKNRFEKEYGVGSFQTIYGDMTSYIASNYLIDYMSEKKEPINYIYDVAEFSDLWCSINTKLIIQRGYRIHKDFIEKWDINHAKEVCEAFKAVGLPPDPDAEHGLPYTIIGEWKEV